MSVSRICGGVEHERIVAVAEQLLAFQAEVFPELAVPDDTGAQVHEGDNYSGSVELFEQLLTYERSVEGHLFEWFQTLPTSVDYRLVFTSDNGGHIECRACAVIRDSNLPPLGIPLDLPTVDGLIAACAESSLADCVRVFTYLVRVFCEIVGPVRDLDTFSGELVRCFAQSVGVLRSLVSAMRLEQRDDGADRANERYDDAQQIGDFHVQDSSEEATK